MNRKSAKKFLKSVAVLSCVVTLFASCSSTQNVSSSDLESNSNQTSQISESSVSQTEESVQDKNSSDSVKDGKDKTDKYSSQKIHTLTLKNKSADIHISDHNNNSDEDSYTGILLIKTATDSKELTSPAISNDGVSISKADISSHFVTATTEINGSECDIICFLSNIDKNEKFCTVYVIDGDGKIYLLDYPQYSESVAINGNIIKMDDKSYTVDTATMKLVKN